MNQTDNKINEAFKQVIKNYDHLIGVCKWELAKGYDNEFWLNMLNENTEKKHQAENQILKYIPSEQK